MWCVAVRISHTLEKVAVVLIKTVLLPFVTLRNGVPGIRELHVDYLMRQFAKIENVFHLSCIGGSCTRTNGMLVLVLLILLCILESEFASNPTSVKF